MSFNLEIVSPARMVFQGEVKSVTIPGTLGSFQVLQNHAPLISTFIVGRVKVEKDSETIEYSTSGGVFEVKNNKAIVLADSIETKEEIDIERAKLSKIRAEEILKIENSSVNEKEEAKFAIQKAENRIKVIENK